MPAIPETPADRPVEFVLRLRDVGGGVSLAARLRSALKTLLRCYELRCTSVEEVPPPGPPPVWEEWP